MKVVYLSLTNVEKLDDNLSLCLGNFDGLHLGHIEIIKKAINDKLGPVGVLTFDISPKFYLGINQNEEILTTVGDKTRILMKLGVDFLIVVHVDDDLINMSPEDFINKIIIRLGTKNIYCGEDFRFGKGNAGSPTSFPSNLNVSVLSLLGDKDGKFSTTRIIDSIKKGNVEEANKMLGRYYEITGQVVKGDEVGRTIDFPTANLKLSLPFSIPKNGVYYTKVYVHGNCYQSMTNVGTHPTINNLSSPIIEVNILDFDENIYDWSIFVQFITFLRDEKKFAKLEDLKAQLQKDQNKVRLLSKKYPNEF